MIKTKVAEATGAVLDWMVSRCVIFKDDTWIEHGGVWWKDKPFIPSSAYECGGWLLGENGIASRSDSKGVWYAMMSVDLGNGERAQWVEYTFRGLDKTASQPRLCRFQGSTQLEACMRCLVASKLGEIVEVPEELTDKGHQDEKTN